MWDLAGEEVVAADDARSDAKADAVSMTRAACLEQILEAFCDIADRDDIHQAARRLILVQTWIAHEAASAAANLLVV